MRCGPLIWALDVSHGEPSMFSDDCEFNSIVVNCDIPTSLQNLENLKNFVTLYFIILWACYRLTTKRFSPYGICRYLYYTAYVRAVPEIILGGRRHFFVRWGESVLLTMCPRGGGWRGNLTCPGGQGIFDPQWGGLIKALTCPGGRGALTTCVSWGWRGLKKKVAPPG